MILLLLMVGEHFGLREIIKLIKCKTTCILFVSGRNTSHPIQVKQSQSLIGEING